MCWLEAEARCRVISIPANLHDHILQTMNARTMSQSNKANYKIAKRASKQKALGTWYIYSVKLRSTPYIPADCRRGQVLAHNDRPNVPHITISWWMCGGCVAYSAHGPISLVPPPSTYPLTRRHDFEPSNATSQPHRQRQRDTSDSHNPNNAAVQRGPARAQHARSHGGHELCKLLASVEK